MAREYWYMQLRRCVMCSSIWSLIASVLSDQKPLLTPGKRLGGGASAVEHTEFRGCYKVGSPVAVPANATRETRPVAYPRSLCAYTSSSPGHPATVRVREPG